MKADVGKAKKKDRPVYSVADNVLFLMKRIGKVYPMLLVLMGIECVFSVAGPVAGIWLPRVAVELAQERASLLQIAVRLGGLGGIMALSMALSSMAGLGKYMRLNNLRYLYRKELFMASLCCEYAQIEGVEGQRRYTRARSTLDDGDFSGTSVICNQSLNLIINLGCFAIYSGVISTLDFRVMLLLVGLSLISLLAVRRANAWEFRHKDQEAGLAGKLYYIEWTAKDVQYGKDIRLYSMGPWILRLRDQVMESWTRLSHRIRNRYFAAGAVNAATLFLRDGMVYGYLIGSAAAGRITVSDFVLYFGAVTGFSDYVGRIVNTLNDLHRANLMMNDMRAFLDSVAEQERRENQKKEGRRKGEAAGFQEGRGAGPEKKGAGHEPSEAGYTGTGISIDFENVTFSYKTASCENDPDKGLAREQLPETDFSREKAASETASWEQGAEPVLRDFNLHIKGGERIALVGVNGAGKTTVVKLLCGFFRPDSGRILIDGRDLRDFSRQERYGLFSTVFQDIYIPPFTVAENVSMRPEADTDMERVAECLSQVGLYEKICEYPEGIHSCMLKAVHDGIVLSGGEQQKLLMARALYKDAPVLILDEPTAALDPVAESETYENFHRFTLGQPTAIYISHRLASTRFCDRIVLLGEGKVREEGSHRELMEKGGEYARMYELQSQYYRSGRGEGEEVQGG